MAAYLGDIPVNDIIHFPWSTNNKSGASITRATDGEVRVYKDNDAAQSTAGITDTEDFDGLTGIHMCTIDTSDAFYAKGSNYSVVLQGATIDGETVNAVLALFSIENRAPYVGALAELVQAQPPTNPTPAQAQMLLYMALRDESRTAGALYELKNNAGAVVAKQTLTDDGTTFTRAKMVSGP